MPRDLPASLPLRHLDGRLVLDTATATVVDGRARLDRFARLLTAADPRWQPGDREVEAHLELVGDGRGGLLVSGRAGAVVGAICQRCLAPVEIRIAAEVHARIVVAGAGAEIDDDVETFELEGETLDVVSFVEDELILAQPLHPSHPPGACSAPPVNDDAGAEEAPRDNPFAELANLELERDA